MNTMMNALLVLVCAGVCLVSGQDYIGRGGGQPRRCAGIQCGWPICPGGEQPVTKPGDCCPSCPDRPTRPTLPWRPHPGPDCSRVACTLELRICRDGRPARVQPGECCPRCVDDNIGVHPPNCALIQCDWPNCPGGVLPVTRPGDCCPSCPDRPTLPWKPHPGPDCSRVACTLEIRICRDGRPARVQPGECCPRCVDDKIGGEKPGQCPYSRATGFGLCPQECSSDYSCPGRQKCCDNGCARQCRTPVRGFPEPRY